MGMAPAFLSAVLGCRGRVQGVLAAARKGFGLMISFHPYHNCEVSLLFFFRQAGKGWRLCI